jgi:hypothetical protein
MDPATSWEERKSERESEPGIQVIEEKDAFDDSQTKNGGNQHSYSAVPVKPSRHLSLHFDWNHRFCGPGHGVVPAAVIVSGILGLRGTQQWTGRFRFPALRIGKILREFQEADSDRLLHQVGTRI